MTKKAIDANRLKKPTTEADVYAQENLVDEMEQFMVFPRIQWSKLTQIMYCRSRRMSMRIQKKRRPR